MLEKHPLDHYIDLSCLTFDEAKVILTQKLVDIAEVAQSNKIVPKPMDFVLTVKVMPSVYGVVEIVESMGIDCHNVER